MTSRQTLSEQARMKRNSLVQALRKPGKHPGLIAQRARALLLWAPADVNREKWLGSILPEGWHLDKTLEALHAAVQTNGDAAVVVEQSPEPGEGQRSRTRQRHSR